MIHWELYEELKFDHANKWYLHNREFVVENETHKFLWEFEIQTDHLISARRPDLAIIKKKKKRENVPSWEFALMQTSEKNETKQKDP